MYIFIYIQVYIGCVSQYIIIITRQCMCARACPWTHAQCVTHDAMSSSVFVLDPQFVCAARSDVTM